MAPRNDKKKSLWEKYLFLWIVLIAIGAGLLGWGIYEIVVAVHNRKQSVEDELIELE